MPAPDVAKPPARAESTITTMISTAMASTATAGPSQRRGRSADNVSAIAAIEDGSTASETTTGETEVRAASEALSISPLTERSSHTETVDYQCKGKVDPHGSIPRMLPRASNSQWHSPSRQGNPWWRERQAAGQLRPPTCGGEDA